MGTGVRGSSRWGWQVTFLLTTALVLATAPSAEGAVEAPAYVTGDRWVYDVEVRSLAGFEGVVENLTAEGTITYRTVGLVTVDVGSETYGAYGFSLEGEGDVTIGTLLGTATAISGTWVMTGTEFLEQDGLELVRSVQEWTFDLRFVAPGSGTVEVEGGANVTSESRILNRTWGYPYDVGASGRLELEQTVSAESHLAGVPLVEESQNRTVSVAVSCTALTSVDAPAGTFDAYTVRREDDVTGLVTVDYFSPDVRNVVRREELNASGALVGEQVLRSYGPETVDPEPVGFAWAAVFAMGVIVLVVAVVAMRRRAASQAPHSRGQVGGSTGDQPPVQGGGSRGRTSCPECGEAVRPWVGFCPECGTFL